MHKHYCAFQAQILMKFIHNQTVFILSTRCFLKPQLEQLRCSICFLDGSPLMLRTVGNQLANLDVYKSEETKAIRRGERM